MKAQQPRKATINTPQQLNMADRIAVRRNIIDRCTGIVADYALYIIGEATNTPNHAGRKQWADDAIKNSGSFGDRVSWYVLNQTTYLNGGSSIDDTELKNVVQAAINANFISIVP